jgi:hypothetical protein
VKLLWQDHSNVPIAKEQIQIGKDTDKHLKELKESEYVETARKDLQPK